MKFKKTISIILIISMIFSLGVYGFSADLTDDFTYGTYGSDLKILSYNGSDSEVEIPTHANGKAVVAIDKGAFRNNIKLTTVVLSSNIISIGINAFSGCTALTAISVPASVGTVGDYAFSGCSSLTTLDIASANTKIGVGAFLDCTSLFTVVIPSSTIGYGAFENCTSLVNIELGEGVKSVGENAFANTAWENRYSGDTLYLGSLLYKYRGSDATVYIQDGTRCIADCAFENSSVERAVIPDTVYYLGTNCFNNCRNMTYISLPESIEEVGNKAFGYVAGVRVLGFTVYGKSGSVAAAKAFSNNLNFIMTDGHEHDFLPWVTETEVLCEADGLRSRECKMCNFKELQTIEHVGHIWTEPEVITASTCTQDGISLRHCTVCLLQENVATRAPGHQYGDWTVTKEPTCTEKGERVRVCSVCGGKATEKIDKIAHKWTVTDKTDKDGWTVSIKPTCSSGGRRDRKCSVCGFVFTEVMPKTAHNVKSWKVTVTATTYRDGERTGKCSLCNKTITEKIPKIPEKLPTTVEKIQLANGSDLDFGKWKSDSGIGTLIVPADTKLSDCLEGLKYPGHMIVLDKTGSKIVTDYDSLVSTGMYISLVVDPSAAQTNVNVIESVVVLVPGDVNCDGKLNANDARFTLRVSARLEKITRIAFLAADTDENDTINASDARKILRVSARLESL